MKMLNYSMFSIRKCMCVYRLVAGISVLARKLEEQARATAMS